MTRAPATAMSYAAYLELERSAESKHEYVNGLVYAMAGGTIEHASCFEGEIELASLDVRISLDALYADPTG